MSIHSFTFTTTETAPAAPHAEDATHTISDYQWLLARYTSPGWTVESTEFEHNDHSGAKCTVLSASLRHKTGSHLQILPFDPWEHYASPTLYRRHRVRLRDSARDENNYLTISNDIQDLNTHLDIGDALLVDSLATPNPDAGHPFPDLEDVAAYHAQADVHYRDGEVIERTPQNGRGYNVRAIDHAVVLAMAGAQRVSRHAQQQTGLDAFTTHA